MSLKDQTTNKLLDLLNATNMQSRLKLQIELQRLITSCRLSSSNSTLAHTAKMDLLNDIKLFIHSPAHFKNRLNVQYQFFRNLMVN